jgi:hypothetical protein
MADQMSGGPLLGVPNHNIPNRTSWKVGYHMKQCHKMVQGTPRSHKPSEALRWLIAQMTWRRGFGARPFERGGERWGDSAASVGTTPLCFAFLSFFSMVMVPNLTSRSQRVKSPPNSPLPRHPVQNDTCVRTTPWMDS